MKCTLGDGCHSDDIIATDDAHHSNVTVACTKTVKKEKELGHHAEQDSKQPAQQVNKPANTKLSKSKGAKKLKGIAAVLAGKQTKNGE